MYTGVAEGLSYVHSKNILHNDVKADNVALSDCLPACDNAPTNLWPTLVDFSKACPSSKGKKYTLLPQQREAYKKRYSHLAPDLVDGRVKQSCLSDVYSFGKLMEKMAPVESSSIQDLACRSICYLCNDRQKLPETVTALKLLL